MIWLIFFIFNFQLKAPTTEFVNRDGKRLTVFPSGIEIYEEKMKVMANYGEFDPQEKIFLFKDSVRFFLTKDTGYTGMAIYKLKEKKWEMPAFNFLIIYPQAQERLTIKSEKATYDWEKEILFLEKGEIKLKNKLKLLGEKIVIDNKKNFLYSYLTTKVMNYLNEEKLNNFLTCETLFYDFKNDTGVAKSKVNYTDTLSQVFGDWATFILEKEEIKEVIFRNKVLLSWKREAEKMELACEKLNFFFDKNDLKMAVGENIFAGKIYLKRK
jgi:hypothetical protein